MATDQKTETPPPLAALQPPPGDRRPVSAGSHYWRLALVLLLVVVGFLCVRALMVPDSFGRDGHYRASAVGEIVAKEPRYLGNDTCSECHNEDSEVHDNGSHNKLSCEVCHGPSKGHLTLNDKLRVSLAVDRSQESCLQCHEKITGRPRDFPMVVLKKHRSDKEFGANDSCLKCHMDHDPVGGCGSCHAEQLETHSEGAHKDVACGNCHGPTKGHLTLSRGRVPMGVDKSQENCLRCHSAELEKPDEFPTVELDRHREKRGFAEDESCTECHEGHDPEP